MSDLVAWLTQILKEDALRNGGHEEDCESYLQRKCDCIHGWALADIEAKRAIIANCLTWIGGEPDNAWYDGGRPQDLAEETLRLLGSAYADRLGYLDEWKPRD